MGGASAPGGPAAQEGRRADTEPDAREGGIADGKEAEEAERGEGAECVSPGLPEAEAVGMDESVDESVDEGRDMGSPPAA
ncbi:hypothetical protein ACFZCL_17885 [Streptomyces sp. NPDC008159]|uniref:hypothetical protein n=1 Tax=Streptomyces sp. NPDC008159 TaxID=3364817 RepID=UPI0036E0A32A